jgi:hypothetical protein
VIVQLNRSSHGRAIADRVRYSSTQNRTLCKGSIHDQRDPE